MSTRAWIAIVVVLGIIIIVLAWLLWVTPASAPTLSNTTSQTTTTSNTRSATSGISNVNTASVVVTSPKPNQTVPHTFTVSGSAPGSWFFEAQFPIQVRDGNDDLIGNTPANAQGNWQTDASVGFTATITIDSSFEGAATLILDKDNPSGLPQNADSVQVPIVVQ